MIKINNTKTSKQYEEEINQLKDLVNDLYRFSHIDAMIDDLCISRINDKDDEILIDALMTKSKFNELNFQLDKDFKTKEDSKKLSQDEIDESNENLINRTGGI